MLIAFTQVKRLRGWSEASEGSHLSFPSSILYKGASRRKAARQPTARFRPEAGFEPRYWKGGVQNLHPGGRHVSVWLSREYRGVWG